MPWTREEKIFCISNYLETKSFKSGQANLCWKFNFNNYSQKSHIYCWVHKFQVKGSVNIINWKLRNPRSARKLTARCPENVDAVRGFVGRSQKKSPSESESRSSMNPHQQMDFLVSGINHYHINGLHLFWDIWIQWRSNQLCYKINS